MDNNYLIPGSTLSGIADAIRKKGGTTDVIATEDMAAAIAAIEAGGGNVQYFTLPIGRSRGDVNGDGLIQVSDGDLITGHVSGNNVITDAASLWCADVNGNGIVNSDDTSTLLSFIGGNATISFGDYYGNWEYNTNGYYCVDIPLEGITTTSVVTLMMESHAKSVIEVVCGNGSVQIRMSCCPGVEVACCLIIDDEGRRFFSAPVETTSEPLYTVSINNGNAKPAYYFSKNHKNGTFIARNNTLNDQLEANDMYAVMCDYSMFTSADVGNGMAFCVTGGLPTIYVTSNYESASETYNTLYVCTVDPTATNTFRIK